MLSSIAVLAGHERPLGEYGLSQLGGPAGQPDGTAGPGEGDPAG